MELGATVCVPNTEPKCGECPISASCAAFQAAQAHEREGGDPSAAGAPRVTDYPTKVGALLCCHGVATFQPLCHACFRCHLSALLDASRGRPVVRLPVCTYSLLPMNCWWWW